MSLTFSKSPAWHFNLSVLITSRYYKISGTHLYYIVGSHPATRLERPHPPPITMVEYPVYISLLTAPADARRSDFPVFCSYMQLCHPIPSISISRVAVHPHFWVHVEVMEAGLAFALPIIWRPRTLKMMIMTSWLAGYGT